MGRRRGSRRNIKECNDTDIQGSQTHPTASKRRNSCGEFHHIRESKFPFRKDENKSYTIGQLQEFKTEPVAVIQEGDTVISTQGATAFSLGWKAERYYWKNQVGIVTEYQAGSCYDTALVEWNKSSEIVGKTPPKGYERYNVLKLKLKLFPLTGSLVKSTNNSPQTYKGSIGVVTGINDYLTVAVKWYKAPVGKELLERDTPNMKVEDLTVLGLPCENADVPVANRITPPAVDRRRM